MKLNYSFNQVTPILVPGDAPLKIRSGEKIQVCIDELTGNWLSPSFNAELLTEGEPGKTHGYTLLVNIQIGITPPSNMTAKPGEWTEVPNSPIFGQMRIPLPEDAIKLLHRDPENVPSLSLHITKAEFHDVTNNAT